MIHLGKGERSFSYWRSNAAARGLADDAAWLEEASGRTGTIVFSAITLAFLQRVLGRPGGFCLGRLPCPTCRKSRAEAFKGGAQIASKLDFAEPDPQATITRYQALGLDRIIVKNGGKGIVMSDYCAIRRIETVPVAAVVDSTSAGDSRNGAFLARFTALGSSVEAAHHAAHVASIVTGRQGALIEPTALSVLPGFNPPA